MRSGAMVVAVSALAATVLISPGVSPPGSVLASTTADTPTVNSSDFNDDGYADLAIGANGDDVNGHPGAGVVHVIYGSSDGLRAAGSQVWHQDTSGIGDTAEEGDLFGSALATGDLDNDGYADLAVGIPGEDLPQIGMPGASVADAGAVQILFGGPSGLTAVDSVMWPTATVAADAGGRRGLALAMLDGMDVVGTPDQAPDSYADLAIGSPGHGSGRGRVEVFAGQCLSPESDGCESFFRTFDELDAGAAAGAALARVDYLGSPLDDLVVGAPNADSDGLGLPSVANAGMIQIIELVPGGSTAVITQGPGYFAETRELNDRFGQSVAGGDLDGDGLDELVIGIPGEDLGTKADAGLIEVFQPRSSPFLVLRDQGSPGVPGKRKVNAQFGFSVTVGNFGKGAMPDIAVGAPNWNLPGVSEAGAVVIIYWTASGPATSGNQLWTQDSPGVADVAQAGDNLGSRLFAADFGRSGSSDLAIGVKDEDFSGLLTAGVVHVLYGAGSGLTANRDQRWHQDVPGIGEVAQEDDNFGGALQ